MTTSAFTHIHASGRFDAPLGHVKADWDHYRNLPGVALITGTEHGSGDHDAAFDADGWDWRRLGECVVAWDETVFELAWQPTLTFIGTPFYRGGNDNARTRLLSVPLRHLATGRVVMVRVAHTPAHVQAGNKFRRTTARVIRQATGWSTGLVAWGKRSRRFRKHHPHAAEIAVADWNVSLFSRVWRSLVRRTLKMRCAWTKHMPKIGSHGKRLIDGVFYRLLRVDTAAVLPLRKSSDHRAVCVRFTVTSKD